MTALLRLIDSSGTILVDGIDLALVPRSLVRENCFIAIPQDPFFIPQATMRFNLDPSGSVPDSVLIEALSKVQLWANIDRAHGAEEYLQPLDRRLSSFPTMSAGQSQLLAIARTIASREKAYRAFTDRETGTAAKRMPILLLDEATSSLDPETEKIIHKVIEDEFVSRGHTAIIVTHRLSASTKQMRADQDVLVRMGEHGDLIRDS